MESSLLYLSSGVCWRQWHSPGKRVINVKGGICLVMLTAANKCVVNRRSQLFMHHHNPGLGSARNDRSMQLVRRNSFTHFFDFAAMGFSSFGNSIRKVTLNISHPIKNICCNFICVLCSTELAECAHTHDWNYNQYPSFFFFFVGEKSLQNVQSCCCKKSLCKCSF